MGLGKDLSDGLRVVVFDFDGTLLHLDVDWDGVRRGLGIAGTGETVGSAIQRYARAGDPRLETVTRAELAALGEQRIDPAVDRTLTALAGRYRLAVHTRNSREVVRRAFAGTAAGADLCVIGREDVTRLKPDPEGLRRILDHFGVTAAQAVLVGDTYHDVEAAHAAGMPCLVVRNDRLDHPPAGADRYLDKLADLPPLLTGSGG